MIGMLLFGLLQVPRPPDAPAEPPPAIGGGGGGRPPDDSIRRAP